MSTRNRKKILITTGDTDGVGLEVTFKALAKIPKKLFKKFVFYIYIHPKSEATYIKKLKQTFNHIEIPEDLILNMPSVSTLDHKTEIVLINSLKSPADWIFDASKLCLEKKFSALVTAPLSKTLIQKSGHKEIGHTEILAKVSKSKKLYMLFIGDKFNVVLLTGHQPLQQVSKSLLKFKDTNFSKKILRIRSVLNSKQKNKPFALLGLNPHAGENGIIGAKEESYLNNFFKSQTLPFRGPLVPDVAFQQKFWKEYSLYIALYHDQGLIPFKLVHGQDSGVHITMGLPFVRTSVDHGTAKDLFGKNAANPNSMLDALLWATKLA